MKKLLKSGICGSINSTWCTVCCRKVNICGYCSLNSTWTVTAFCQNAWKKKKKKKTQNANVGSKHGSKHTLSIYWTGNAFGVCQIQSPPQSLTFSSLLFQVTFLYSLPFPIPTFSILFIFHFFYGVIFFFRI